MLKDGDPLIGAAKGAEAAREEGEELTALGLHLSRLPVDVHIGKLILLGAIFNCTNDVLTIAATLSTGPVSIADKPGATNATLVRRCLSCCRQRRLGTC